MATTPLLQALGVGRPSHTSSLPPGYTEIKTFTTAGPVSHWVPKDHFTGLSNGTSTPYNTWGRFPRDSDYISPEFVPKERTSSVYKFPTTIDTSTPWTGTGPRPIHFLPRPTKSEYETTVDPRWDKTTGKLSTRIDPNKDNDGDFLAPEYFYETTDSNDLDSSSVPRRTVRPVYPEMFSQNDVYSDLELAMRDTAETSVWKEGRTENQIRGLGSLYYKSKIETDKATHDRWVYDLEQSQSYMPTDPSDMSPNAVNARGRAETLQRRVQQEMSTGFDNWMATEAQAQAIGFRDLPTAQVTGSAFAPTASHTLPSIFQPSGTNGTAAPSDILFGTSRPGMSFTQRYNQVHGIQPSSYQTGPTLLQNTANSTPYQQHHTVDPSTMAYLDQFRIHPTLISQMPREDQYAAGFHNYILSQGILPPTATQNPTMWQPPSGFPGYSGYGQSGTGNGGFFPSSQVQSVF